MSNKLLQDSYGNASSKRLFGVIGVGLYYIMGAFISGYSVYTGNDIGANAVTLLNGMGITGASLLGIGVVEGFAKRKDL